MMIVRRVDNESIYVGFPISRDNAHRIPDGMEQWINDNTKRTWLHHNGHNTGVYLYGEDALAFKLKWQ
jgi:hypothetical protein